MVIVRRVVADWQNTDEGRWEILNQTTLGHGAPRPEPELIRQNLDHAVSQVHSLRELFTLAHRVTFQLALNPNEVSETSRDGSEHPHGRSISSSVSWVFQAKR